ncbi:IS3 family transposase [Roseibium denhamense]|uniref:IS3 family transposase n=1 Tax=Roseibium denhamense TaxID=76305 RepID=UPI003CC78441
MRFSFIAENQGVFPASRLCQIMNVSPRGHRFWRDRPVSDRKRQDLVLLAQIREQFRFSPGSYGRPRMTEHLKALGLDAGHRGIGRRMR